LWTYIIFRFNEGGITRPWRRTSIPEDAHPLVISVTEIDINQSSIAGCLLLLNSQWPNRLTTIGSMARWKSDCHIELLSPLRNCVGTAYVLMCVCVCARMTHNHCLQKESAAVSKAWKHVILSYIVVAMLPLAKPLSRHC